MITGTSQADCAELILRNSLIKSTGEYNYVGHRVDIPCFFSIQSVVFHMVMLRDIRSSLVTM